MARRKTQKVPSEAPESSLESPQNGTGRNTRASAKKPTESPQKTQKKVFSFRAPADLADSWRVWADAKGLKVDELGERAITEYIRRHKLTEDQQQIYNLKMAQKGAKS